LFNRASSALDSRSYGKALTDFKDYIRQYPQSPLRSAAVLGAAKAALYTGAYDDATRLCDEYIAARPDQRAVALLYRGHVHLARHDVADALLDYGQAFEATRDSTLRNALRAVVKSVAAQLPPEEVRASAELDIPPDLAGPLWINYAGHLASSGHRYEAAQTFKQVADRYAGTKAGVEARQKQREFESILASTARIGVLVPLSGSLKSFGENLRKGIEVASAQYTDSTHRQVELMVMDTGDDAMGATQACQALVSKDPLAIIGPLTSAASVGCAAAAACADVPLVIPAATESGLSSLGDAVFCMSPSIAMYGRELGSYAVNDLKLCSHVIFAPDDAFGREMAREYRRAVEAAGGFVWYEAFYQPGITDFGAAIKPFRESFLDTLSDTTWFRGKDGKTIEPDDVAINPDAVFMPGYVDDLVLLVPQIHFYKISGRLIGTDAFADDELLLRVGPNLEGALLASVEPLARGIQQWETFKARYARKFGGNPNRMAALGYDAFRFVAGGLTDSLVAPRELGKRLRAVAEFKGAAGNAYFGLRGENTRVPIYYINDRQIAAAAR
jgi:branched-chain amino acid transport system substrate-binding protein